MILDNDLIAAIYGEPIEYKKEDIIEFVNPILGFDSLKSFLVLQVGEGESPLYFLQSLDDTDISFSVVNPFLYKENYAFDIDEKTKEYIKLDKLEDLVVFCIVNWNEDPNKSTINLKAPICIQTRSKKAAQLIVDEEYEIKEPFLPTKREVVC